jgi:hypothetical protein
MEWPKVSILIVTYDRIKEIKRTIYALKKHLKYQGELLWHLADDHSPGNYIDDIKREFSYLNFSATITDRKGWGKNVNKALVHCWANSDYVFLNEDDRPPIKNYDLTSGVAVLMSKDDANKPGAATERKPIGMVRYDGIAGHWLNLELREAKTEIGNINYLHVLKNSPFLNCYSNRPALTHRRFYDSYGMIPEGKGLADTESSYAHTFKHSKKGPWIVTLEDGIRLAQDHIGKSRQNSEHDKPKGS